MTAYVQWVTAHPMLSAVVHFAILGTLGEHVSALVKSRRPSLGCTWLQWLGKVAAWGILGIIIKLGFTGMKGFVAALLAAGYLPAALAAGVGRAFAVSLFTNVLFGPQMMFFHRLEENVIMGRNDYSGMAVPLRTLIWFWIPAHTVTFSLPRDYQIGLAALWSVVLGLILGLAAPRKVEDAEAMGTRP